LLRKTSAWASASGDSFIVLISVYSSDALLGDARFEQDA
jgi:hypothetical protein